MDTEEKGIKDVMKPQSSDPSEPQKAEPQKAEPGKGERELKALGDPAPDDLDLDGMVMLARRHYATGFPNPQRRGCPPSGEIVKVVGRGRAPNQSLLTHLFKCSECFGEYRHALAQYRNEVGGGKRLVYISTLTRGSAVAVVLLSLFFGGRELLRKPAPDAGAGQIAHPTASDARIGAAPVTTLNQIAPRRPAGIAALPVKRRATDRASRSSALPGQITVNLDLDDYQVLRELQEEKPPSGDEKAPGKEDEKPTGGWGESSRGESIILLPATHARLVLRLPETGVAGDYTVSLVDAFDQVLLSRRAVSHDGVKLRAPLDLRQVIPEKYRLRLSREGEAPAYYDVIVGKR